ncbi:putative peptidase family m1 protein [Phaeoacremonium minimum UCRPA7]|uniref:Aminopeptidase n=1 Tax=Phaeoacremonium minimum (strain UCR-PA7) TaxID=1286976 RepID=R8B9Q6_PHAM7|nr:putative peptidase family m1 protein [Phaeoacremonium minimum UCRPA7]EON96044.1 putative peptidase family m1 protein [Phaeoacremonium minimum UCRPA7]
MADREILPDNFRPQHYDLVLTDLNFAEWTYKGTVIINGPFQKATKEIVLNSLELTLKKAEVVTEQTKSSTSFTSTTFNYDEKAQRVTIPFDTEIPVSSKASIRIEFTGIMNHDMAGFYRSQYKPAAPPAKSVPFDDDWHYMLNTQFESCDARRAFPCFDEPNLKATFDFAIEIPDDQVALSNMPVKTTTESRAGKKLVAFETSPAMSTYLYAWAVGDFEYIEAFTDRKYNGKQLPVRLYTTRGLKEQGQWALQHAPKIIDFFSEAFEIDYPLPKSDILAVHEFTHGAMENWGLVTYRMTAILFDEKQSEARFRNRIAYVVAHELAHQWFGNLVTMDWWDELWLNEGFATWAGWLAIDHLHPEWEVWPQFINEGMENALKLDGLRSSHPIQVPVRNALDINQVFDAISYLKGCSNIRMLASHLGVKTFLKGVAIYLKKHAYGNAKTKALWDALSEASGQDVNALMKPWIEKIGFPVLTVGEEPRQITVKQSRFLSTGDVKPEDDTTTWWVPLAFQGKIGTQDAVPLALTSREETIRDVDNDFYLINSKATGFYRVNYPPLRLRLLGTQLDRLSTEDKISITGSAADLAFSGYGTTPAMLSFIQGFKNETHYRVLSQALDSIALAKSIFGEDDTIKAGLEKFTLYLIDSALSKLGWDFPQGEDYNTALLRKRLLLTASVNGHPAVQEEAFSRFNAYKESKSLTADLRTPVFRVALQRDPVGATAFLKDEWYNTTAVDGKEVLLLVLGHVSDPEVIKSTLLPFLFNISPPAPAKDSIPSADMHILAGSLANNRVARPLLWEFMKNNWDDIEKKISGNPILLDRLIKVSLSKFADYGMLEEIDSFFADKDKTRFDRTLEQVKDLIRGRAAYKERDAAVLKEWLTTNGYA